jgi:hypothetical protein
MQSQTTTMIEMRYGFTYTPYHHYNSPCQKTGEFSSHGPHASEFLSWVEADNQIHSWKEKGRLVSKKAQQVESPFPQVDIVRWEKKADPKEGRYGRNWIHHEGETGDVRRHDRSLGRSSLCRRDCGNDREGVLAAQGLS